MPTSPRPHPPFAEPRLRKDLVLSPGGRAAALVEFGEEMAKPQNKTQRRPHLLIPRVASEKEGQCLLTARYNSFTVEATKKTRRPPRRLAILKQAAFNLPTFFFFFCKKPFSFFH